MYTALRMLLYNHCLLWVILFRHTKLSHIFYAYSLFTTLRKTIIFVILFFCGEGETLFSFFLFFFVICFIVCLFVFFFFAFVRNLRKDKSNRYVRMKRRHLAGHNLAGMHTKVDDIIPLFYLHFSNAYPIYCRAVVRSGVINIYTSLYALDTQNWPS